MYLPNNFRFYLCLHCCIFYYTFMNSHRLYFPILFYKSCNSFITQWLDGINLFMSKAFRN